jgi:hypothetical protein|tara:strand:+ start:8552 stop:8866 length:315 start_codon:yes stop_codon:yes gene_type:complete
MTAEQAALLLIEEAMTQPVPLDAAGFDMVIHQCGALVWVRTDDRGVYWCDLMSGDRHWCGGPPTKEETERAQMKQRRQQEQGRRSMEATRPAYKVYEDPQYQEE